MSTNYYAKWPNQPADEEGLHIGKSSGGWEFMFRAHPQLGLTSTVAWRQFLDHPWVTIVAEYGVAVQAREFWESVVVNSGADPLRTRDLTGDDFWAKRQWRDTAGHPFADYEFC